MEPKLSVQPGAPVSFYGFPRFTRVLNTTNFRVQDRCLFETPNCPPRAPGFIAMLRPVQKLSWFDHKKEENSGNRSNPFDPST